MRLLPLFPLLPILVALQACDSGGGSSSTSSPATDVDGWDTSYTRPLLSLSADRMEIVYPAYIDNRCGIGNSKLEAEIVRADTVHEAYLLSGDTLWMGGDTSDIDTSGRRIVESRGYVRVSGSGILGVWDFAYAMKLVPVGMPATDSVFQARVAFYDRQMAAMRRGGVAYRHEIGSSSIVERVREGDLSVVAQFRWDEWLSKEYHVAFQVVDSTTVTYSAAPDTVVWVRFLHAGRIIEYSSSHPSAYPTYLEYRAVTSLSQCPQHSWFWDFMEAHRKAASAARSLPETATALARSVASGFDRF